LALVREAKAELERAERLNPRVLNGAVYVTLGSLYAQVPGAPLGFGNRQRARDYLQRGLAMAPDDVDANFFMGDLLIRERDWGGAARYLQRAIDAPARPGRTVADRGRKAEARALLVRAQQHR
jgi:tetratricopeptide (TPR) repeat protein